MRNKTCKEILKLFLPWCNPYETQRDNYVENPLVFSSALELVTILQGKWDRKLWSPRRREGIPTLRIGK